MPDGRRQGRGLVRGRSLGRDALKDRGRPWRDGAKLNLERALRLGDELGGHIVTGHVDGVAEVVGTCPEGDSTRVGIAVPNELRQ